MEKYLRFSTSQNKPKNNTLNHIFMLARHKNAKEVVMQDKFPSHVNCNMKKILISKSPFCNS